MNPSPIVSEISTRGRVPVTSDVAQAMREDAARVEFKETHNHGQFVGGSPRQDDPVRYDALGRDANGHLVSNGKVHGHAVDSDEAQQIVKHINTQTDLRISRWSEISGYLRWAAIALMGSAFAKVGAVAITETGLGLGAIGAAITGAPFLALMGAAVAVAGVSLYMTQSVRKLQANRWMDVQGFMQERSATKVGKEVAKAIDASAELGTGSQWQDAVKAGRAEEVHAGRA